MRSDATDFIQDFPATVDVIDADIRPSFVIDLRESFRSETDLPIAFINAALNRYQSLCHAIGPCSSHGKLTPTNEGFPEFRAWALQFDAPERTIYAGYAWVQYLLYGRFKVISCDLGAPVDGINNGLSRAVAKSGPSANEKSRSDSVPDTGDLAESVLKYASRCPDTAHNRLVWSFPWQDTEYGPVTSWPSHLLSSVYVMLTDTRPAVLFWGKDDRHMYNEAYVDIIGARHPAIMGSMPSQEFAEVWSVFAPIFESVKRDRTGFTDEHVCLFPILNGNIEEKYYSYTFLPIIGPDGHVDGLYQSLNETTQWNLTNRRSKMIAEVTTVTTSLASANEFWTTILKPFDSYPRDVPFAAVFSLCDDAAEDAHLQFALPSHVTQKCRLTSCIGFDLESLQHQLATAPELKNLPAGIYRQLCSGKGVLLSIAEKTLPAYLSRPNASRGFGDKCERAILYPLRSTGSGALMGVLLLALNPREVDIAAQEEAGNSISRQLSASLTGISLYEEEITRSRDIVQHSQQESRRLETRFMRIAALSPVGVFEIQPNGKLAYANDKWYELTDHPRGVISDSSWLENVLDEDREKALTAWKQLTERNQAVEITIRLKKLWYGPGSAKLVADGIPTWVISSAYPDVDEKGILVSVTGCLTDISTQKWSEGESQRQTHQALEAKAQAEKFIDMTSHELRNPLNAIIQSADSVLEAMNSLTISDEDPAHSRAMSSQVYDTTTQAAETILYCAQHQKRVVDDILTLSKMDARLLTITPEDVNISEFCNVIMAMFKDQAQKAAVKLQIAVDESIKSNHLDWVKMDPSRVLQILINLVGNAIKFTASSDERTILVTIAASKDGVLQQEKMTYFPTKPRDFPGTSQKTDEADLFLHFTVRDSGKGLSEEEQRKMFQRFSQASPRTHVKFGGSGLGLFISRELTELQSGEIGLASTPGKGSVFTFYIKVQKGQAPVTTKPTSLTVLGVNGMTTSSKISSTPDTTILIVEDNIINQRVLKQGLLKWYKTVHVANHGLECLDFLRKTRHWAGKKSKMSNGGKGGETVDVILMDIEMPQMDGMTCTRRIRELERDGDLRMHIPVIAVTANARHEQVNEAKNAGCDDFIPKPYRIPEMVALIERTLVTSHDTIG